MKYAKNITTEPEASAHSKKGNKMKKPIQINGDCQFLKDLETPNPVNKGVYNLMITKRDLSLYSKGIKPHRKWKISDVKKYFGINGNKETLLNKINLLHEVVLGNNTKQRKLK